MKRFTAGALAYVGTDTTVDTTAAQSSGSGWTFGSVPKWQLQQWLHSTYVLCSRCVEIFAAHLFIREFATRPIVVVAIRPATNVLGYTRGLGAQRLGARGFGADRPDFNDGLRAPFRSRAQAVAARPPVGRCGGADGRSGF